jgi:hypothetical protein
MKNSARLFTKFSAFRASGTMADLNGKDANPTAFLASRPDLKVD